MCELSLPLAAAKPRHGHPCPRRLLPVRMARAEAEAVGWECRGRVTKVEDNFAQLPYPHSINSNRVRVPDSGNPVHIRIGVNG